MKLTLDAAAKQVGTSKSTLLRAIKSGALTAEKRGERAYVVDGSELGRWHSSRVIAAPAAEPEPAVAQPDAGPDLAAEVAAWRVKAEMLERMLDAAERDKAALQTQLAKAQDTVLGITRLLPSPEASRPEPQGWLARLLRG